MKKNFFGIAAGTLRAGVAISAVFLVAALADAVIAPDAVGTVKPSELAAAVRSVVSFETGALVHLGLAVLLLTPIARLVAVGTEFARRREITFVLMTVGVLLLLCASVFIGMA
jgi:uncharacterized membrane protein